MLCKEGKTDCKFDAFVIVRNSEDPTEPSYLLCKTHLETEVDGVKIYKTSEMKIEIILKTPGISKKKKD